MLLLDADSTYRQQALADLKANLPLLLALLEIRPEDSELWDACAAQLHEERRWSEALRLWQRRREQEPADPQIGYQLSLLQVAAGDPEGYADTCRKLIDRYATEEIDSPSDLVAWCCVLAPQACDDYGPLFDLVSRDYSPVNASRLTTRGAALMRSGHIAEAIAKLEEGAQFAIADERPTIIPPAYGWYLLAIANSQAGNREAARQWHEMAQSWTRKQIESRSSRVDRWNRRLTLEVLERESAVLLQPRAGPGK